MSVASFRNAALACVTALPFVMWAAPASPAQSFDGAWSVSVTTNKGVCASGYRYAVRIANGVVSQDGGSDAVITGRVNDGGAITVTVVNGYKKATGSGRLDDNGGAGRWSGISCSGSWRAERG